MISIVISTLNDVPNSNYINSLAGLLRSYHKDIKIIYWCKSSVREIQDISIHNVSVKIVKDFDSGLYDSWNKVTPYIDSKYVMYLGEFDFPGQPFLEDFIFEKNKKFDFFAGFLSKEKKLSSQIRSQNFFVRRCDMPFYHAGLIISYDLIKDFKYDVRYKILGDLEWWQRVKKLKPRISYSKNIQIEIVGNGMSAKISKRLINEYWSALDASWLIKTCFIGIKLLVLLRQTKYESQ
jgi:hypothetical protein